MERFIDRFDKYMKLKGLNDNMVTEQMSLSIGLLGKSRKEGRDLSKKMIEAILNFYTDIEKVWFLTGVGDVITGTNAKPENYPTQEKVNVSGETITLYTCPECVNKQKEIESLKRENHCLELANAALNELLAKYRDDAKKETKAADSA